MVDISHELRKDYSFIGSTDRVHVFGRRPYIPAFRNWEMLYPDCPKEFLMGKKPIREPLLYCGLCNNYARDHGHKCTDDGPWGPYPSDDPDTDWAIRIKDNPGHYSKLAPATILNSFSIINSTSHYCFYSTLIRKARGQVTVAEIVKVTIHSNHDRSL